MIFEGEADSLPLKKLTSGLRWPVLRHSGENRWTTQELARPVGHAQQLGSKLSQPEDLTAKLQFLRLSKDNPKASWLHHSGSEKQMFGSMEQVPGRRQSDQETEVLLVKVRSSKGA